MKIAKKSLVYILLIFLAGVVTGGVLGLSWSRQQMSRTMNFNAISRQIKAELTEKLNLDSAQQEKVGPLVDRSIERIRGIYADTLQRIDGVLLDEQKFLVADLRPDQIAKLGTIAKSRKEFIQKHNPLEADSKK